MCLHGTETRLHREDRMTRYPDQRRDPMYLGQELVEYRPGLLYVYGEEGEQSCLISVRHRSCQKDQVGWWGTFGLTY